MFFAVWARGHILEVAVVASAVVADLLLLNEVDHEEEHDLQHFHTADNDVNVRGDGASFDFDTCCGYMEHMLLLVLTTMLMKMVHRREEELLLDDEC